jgi:hypothetical protein
MVELLKKDIVSFIPENGEPDFSCGITTSKCGDFGYNYSNGFFDRKWKKSAKKIVEIVNAKEAFFLRPNHCKKVDLNPKKNGGCIKVVDSDYYFQQTAGGSWLGLIHCSWITLDKGLVEIALRRLIRKIGNDYQSFGLYVYSGICPRCYEVMDDVAARFRGDFSEYILPNIQPDKYNLDLAGIINAKLSRLGLNAQLLEFCPHHFNVDGNFIFFSHRRKEKKRNLVYAVKDECMLAGTTGDCPYVIVVAD